MVNDSKARNLHWLGVGAWALAGAVTLAGRECAAAVPTEPPVFSKPLEFTNPYFPFSVGDVKLFRGKDGKKRVAAAESYLTETRTFNWNGAAIEARIVREVEFVNGKVTEISRNYFAAADGGTIYFFGEVVDEYANGTLVGHAGSWLVGGAAAGDPPETVAVADPTVIMPAVPEVGDQFKPEDIAPIADETVTVEKFVKKVKVEAGAFHDVLQVKETSSLDPDGFERKWHAPGVGVIRLKDGSEAMQLIATTQQAEQGEAP